MGEIPRVFESSENTHEKSFSMARLADSPVYIKTATQRQYIVASSLTIAVVSLLSDIRLAIRKPSHTARMFPRKYNALLLD